MKSYIETLSIKYSNHYVECFKSYKKEVVVPVKLLKDKYLDTYNKFFNSIVILDRDYLTNNNKNLVLPSEEEFNRLKEEEVGYWRDFNVFENPEPEFVDLVKPFIERYDGVFVIIGLKLYYFSEFKSAKVNVLKPHSNIPIDTLLTSVSLDSDKLINHLFEAELYGFNLRKYMVSAELFTKTYRKEYQNTVAQIYETDTTALISELKTALKTMEKITHQNDTQDKKWLRYRYLTLFIEIISESYINLTTTYPKSFKGIKFIVAKKSVY